MPYNQFLRHSRGEKLLHTYISPYYYSTQYGIVIARIEWAAHGPLMGRSIFHMVCKIVMESIDLADV